MRFITAILGPIGYLGSVMISTKKAFALVIAISAASSCYSQLYVGPVIGAQVSSVRFFEEDDRAGYSSLPSPGFYAGGMVSMKVHNTFFLSGQLLYSEKGKWTQGKDTNSEFKNNSHHKFIELPIFYTLEFPHRSGNSTKGGLVKQYNWFVGGGPIISYWLGGRGKLKTANLHENFVEELKYHIEYYPDNSELSEDLHGDVMNVETANRFQFGLNFTGGIAVQPVGLQRIVAAVHLELGQTFLSRESKGYFPASFVDSEIMKGRWTGIRMSASYMFDTKISEKDKGKSTKDKEVKSRKKKKRR